MRVGSCRVVFKKEKTNLVILIIRIGHRKNIYAKTLDNSRVEFAVDGRRGG
jgi:hypothetical protein